MSCKGLGLSESVAGVSQRAKETELTLLNVNSPLIGTLATPARWVGIVPKIITNIGENQSLKYTHPPTYKAA